MVTRHRSRRSASASRTPASTSPLALGPAEDWTTIQDPGLRRRLQNRLAQRRYRQRLAEAANVGECPAPATRLHSTSLPLDIQMPVEYDHIVAGFYAGLAQVDSSSGHDDFPLFDAWTYSEPASYPGGLQQSHLVGNVYNPAGTGRFYTEAEDHHTSQPVNQDWGTMFPLELGGDVNDGTDANISDPVTCGDEVTTSDQMNFDEDASLTIQLAYRDPRPMIQGVFGMGSSKTRLAVDEYPLCPELQAMHELHHRSTNGNCPRAAEHDSLGEQSMAAA